MANSHDLWEAMKVEHYNMIQNLLKKISTINDGLTTWADENVSKDVEIPILMCRTMN